MKKYVFFLFLLGYNLSFSQDIINTSFVLDQIVLTGQYHPTHLDSSIYSIDIITKEEINSFGSQNLSSVLSREIGIDVFHDPFLGSYVDFQGFSGENIKILIDGIEVSGMQNGSVDFSQISIRNVERIEVVQGPLSTIYGNNALGATINLITKTTQGEKINMVIDSYFESVGQYNASIDLGYKIGENILFTSIGRNYFDGWSNDDPFFLFKNSHFADSTRFNQWKPKEQLFIKSKYLYKTKNNLLIKPYFDFFNEEIINKGLPQGSFGAYAFDDFFYTKRFDKGLLIKGPFLNRNIDIVFHHSQYNRIRHQYYKNLTNLEESLTNNIDTTKINVINHRVTCSNLTDRKLNYQYGYAINHENITTKRVIEGGQKRTHFSFFSSIDYTFKKVDLRGAFRYLYSDKNQNAFTPALNLKFNFPDMDIRFSYANGFRIPSLKEMHFNFIDINHNIQGNSNLKSEYSKNFQLTFDSKFLNPHKLNLNFFYNQIDDFITLIQNQNSITFDYLNIGSYETIGAKLGLKLNFNNLKLNCNLSYLGNSSPYISDINFYTTFNSSIKYDIDSNNSISIFYSLKGSRPILFKNIYGEIEAEDISSYHMLDVSYNTSLFDNVLHFSIGCNNLLNIKNIDSETLISSFHNTENTGIPISCGRYLFTSLKFNLSYDQ